MKKQKSKKGFLPLSSMTAGIMDPLLQKKAGLNMRLVQNWAEIAGQTVAGSAVPLKIIWPRQPGGLGGAILIIGCSGYAAVKLQHETAEIIARINRFFGYQAIGKIRIEQKMLSSEQSRAPGRSLGGGAAGWTKTAFGFAAAKAPAVMAEAVKADIAEIHDEALRASLSRLGRAVHSG